MMNTNDNGLNSYERALKDGRVEFAGMDEPKGYTNRSGVFETLGLIERLDKIGIKLPTNKCVGADEIYRVASEVEKRGIKILTPTSEKLSDIEVRSFTEKVKELHFNIAEVSDKDVKVSFHEGWSDDMKVLWQRNEVYKRNSK